MNEKDTETGMDGHLDGWLEKGSSGFEHDGHYYMIILQEKQMRLALVSIRQGRMMSMEPSQPKCLLVPAKIELRRGRHVAVYPNQQSTQEINRAILADGRRGYVIRNYIQNKEKGAVDLESQDFVFGFVPSGESPAQGEKPIKVFVSYCHADEQICQSLLEHLSGLVRNKIITSWYDGQIFPGATIGPEIETNLRASQIVLLLVSSAFLGSNYCMKVEMKIALEMHARHEAEIVPIILRPCDWQDEAFGKFKALPKDGKSITQWANHDEAFLDVVQGLKSLAAKLKKI